MANADTTTLTAAQVHPVFRLFSLAISDHIPPFDDTFRWEDAAKTACEEHGDDVPLNITPAEAWVAMTAIEVAINSDVVSRADHEVGIYLLNRLEEAMEGEEGIRSAVDVIARLDWAMAYAKENCLNSEPLIPVLRRVRWDAKHLMPEHGLIIDRRPPPAGGPTVGEVRAVESAFAKIGLSKKQAHEVVGLTIEAE